MRCQVCGHENPEGATYCEICGGVLAAKFRADDANVRQSKDELRVIIRNRKATDNIIPTWLIWIPLLIYFIGIIAAVAWMFAALSGPSDFDTFLDTMITAYSGLFAVLVVYQLIFSVISYYLVRRQNEHSMRELQLKRWITKFARTAAGNREAQAAISRDLESLDSYAAVSTRRREPGLWAFLIATPVIGVLLLILSLMTALESDAFAGFVAGILLAALFGLIGYIAMMYMFYFLTKELDEHETNWIGFTHSSTLVLHRLGVPVPTYQPRVSPDRSFALYFVLSLFIPFFLYYWWYVLMKDPNEHYRDQWSFEEGLLRGLEGGGAAVTPSSASWQ